MKAVRITILCSHDQNLFVFKCFLKFPGHHATKKIKLADNQRQMTSFKTPTNEQEQEEVHCNGYYW